jgi:hypothetical protein
LALGVATMQNSPGALREGFDAIIRRRFGIVRRRRRSSRRASPW